jgi:hypothetical protein
VDTNVGTCDIAINGVLVARLGQDERYRLVKTDYFVRLQPFNRQESLLFSNIWVGPWNGEQPLRGEADAGTTTLINGDVAPGVPKSIRAGILRIDSDLGELAMPVEKALAVNFGGAMDAPRALARIRLTDGTMLNLDEFQWDERGVSAHSPTLGDLRLPRAAIAELIYAPARTHAPLDLGPQKSEQNALPNNAQPALIRQ